jgi:hypothetical protein
MWHREESKPVCLFQMHQALIWVNLHFYVKQVELQLTGWLKEPYKERISKAMHTYHKPIIDI